MRNKDQVSYVKRKGCDVSPPTKVHISFPDNFLVVLTTNTLNMHVIVLTANTIYYLQFDVSSLMTQ